MVRMATLILGLLLVASIALAFPMGGSMNVEANIAAGTDSHGVQVKTKVRAGGEVNIYHRVIAPPVELHRIRHMVMERLRERFKIMVRIPEEKIISSVEANLPVRKFVLEVKKINRVFRETFTEYRNTFLEWLNYRQLYLRGEIDENVYLEKTKEFLQTAISVAIKRLETLQDTNAEDTNVDELINVLIELNVTVSSVNDLNTLRALYREEIKPLLEVVKEITKEYYSAVSFMAMTGVVIRAEVALKKMEHFFRMGIARETNEIRALMNHIKQIKEEIEELKQSYLDGEISGEDFLTRLKELRDELRAVIEEIRNAMKMEVRVRAQVRTEAGVRGGRG